MGSKHQSVISHYVYRENPNGSISYSAVVTSMGTMGKMRGEHETLTGVVLPGQNLRERIKHHASVRGFGQARFALNFDSSTGSLVGVTGGVPEW